MDGTRSTFQERNLEHMPKDENGVHLLSDYDYLDTWMVRLVLFLILPFLFEPSVSVWRAYKSIVDSLMGAWWCGRPVDLVGMQEGKQVSDEKKTVGQYSCGVTKSGEVQRNKDGHKSCTQILTTTAYRNERWSVDLLWMWKMENKSQQFKQACVLQTLNLYIFQLIHERVGMKRHATLSSSLVSIVAELWIVDLAGYGRLGQGRCG